MTSEMLRKLLVAGAAVAALSVSACALNSNTLSDATALVQALNAAGCQGTLHVAGSATTAAMGVPSASISNTFDGSCAPPNAAKPATVPAPAPAAAPAAPAPTA